jgi:ATP-dependent DNA helicase PIF1
MRVEDGAQRLPGTAKSYFSVDRAVCESDEDPSERPEELLCNGARLIVRHMHDHVLDCELMSGAVHGRRVLIPRIKLQPTGDALPFDFTRKQFPVRPAFAMTINKAQGQTFKRVGLLLEDAVFSHGQLYVAFSRVRSFAAVRVKLAQGATRTKNVVYREIFD